MVPFPVKLDLPPMDGAVFGVDATEYERRQFLEIDTDSNRPYGLGDDNDLKAIRESRNLQ